MVVAETIKQQLGGVKFQVCTGNFMGTKNSLSFRLPRANNGIKFVKIALNSMDLYDINFYSLSGKPVSEINGVYDDQLVEIFEAETGLVTKLF